MWFIRRMLRITWSAKKSNETELRGADKTRSLINRIGTDKQTFLVM